MFHEFMQIIWHGQSCFQILTPRNKGEQTSIVIDPFDESLGLRIPKLEADILLITNNHPDHNNVRAVLGTHPGVSPFVISGPGEYEIKNVFIQGIPSWYDSAQSKEKEQNTIYTLRVEDLKLCHLGGLGQKELAEEQLDRIGEVDILMIPIGGIFTISAKEAIKIMSQIEPKITIPMHYQIPKLNPPAGGKLDGVDKFLKSLGVKSIEPQNKLSIKKKDISPEEAKVIVLKP